MDALAKSLVSRFNGSSSAAAVIVLNVPSRILDTSDFWFTCTFGARRLLVRSHQLVLSVALAHSQILALSGVMVHSLDLALTQNAARSCSMVLSNLLTHS
jgi:hypothetical protein